MYSVCTIPGTAGRIGLLLLVTLAVVAQAQPYSLAASRATTAAGSATSSTSWSDVTNGGSLFQVTVEVPSGTADVLVMASFSSNPSAANSDTGQWRLYRVGPLPNLYSTVIDRTLTANSNDHGVATVTWLFTGLAAGNHTFGLQSQTLGNGVQTTNATLVAVPLIFSTTPYFTLNADADNSGGYDFTSSSTIGETVEKAAGDIAASVTMAHSGKMFVAASFNARPGVSGALHTGEWELQVDGTTISSTERTMQAAGGNDRGAITIYGLAEGLTSGAHTVTLLAKSVSGDPVITYNAVVTGVDLTFDNAGVANRLPAWVAAGSNSLVAPGTGNVATEYSVAYGAATDVFLAASYNSRTEVRNTAQSGSFQIYTSAGPTSYSGETEVRALSGITDIGSGGNVGLATSLSAGSYDFSLKTSNLQTSGGQPPTMTTNAVLVGFGLTSELTPVGTIEGRVFLDANSSGTYEAPEGVAGVGVTITASDGVVYSLVTDANGFFRQTGVATGAATVDVDDTGLPTQTVGTDPTGVTVTDGGTVSDTNGYEAAGVLAVAKTTTNGTSFTIGETIDYRVTISVPAGATFNTVVVTDTLPNDLDIQAVTTPTQILGVALSGGVTTSLLSYGTHTVTMPQVLVVNFGTVTGGATDGTITITYTGTVLNTTNNNGGESDNNDVVVTWGAGSASDSATITLAEPELSITKTVRNVTTCTPSRSREGKLDYHAPEADDLLEYTITLTNTSAITAHNVTIVDSLDVGLEYITATGDDDYRLPEGDITTNPDTIGDGKPGTPDTPMTLTWGHVQTTPLDLDIAASDTLTFHYRVRVRPSGEIAASQSLNNSATATWYSLDGGSGRSGTGGVNDYTVTASTTTVTAWSDPSVDTFTVSGTDAAVADSGVTSGADIDAGTVDGLSLLLLQGGASVTVAEDGMPNHVDGDPDPFGTPSITVAVDASAVVVNTTTTGTTSFSIDDLVINAGATLELQGYAAYRIGSLAMGVGATLIVPDGAELRIRGLASLQGAADEVNHARLQTPSASGSYTVYFDCSVDADFVHFSGMGSGHVEFAGPTALNHAIFTDGSGTDPYVQYFYSGSPTWTYLAFDKADGKTTTIENLNTGTVTVDHYMGPTLLNWLGGDSSDSESPGVVTWLNGTPARDLQAELVVPESGGVLVRWQTSLEEGVCTYRIMRGEEGRWVAAGEVFAQAEAFRGASYEFLDRQAPVGEVCRYRLDVIDNDGTSRPWDLGQIAATAAASPTVRRASQTPFPNTATRNSPTVTRMPDQVASYATDTPTQTGTARKTNITRTGLYQAPATGTLYNVGRELPRLGNNLVLVRGLSDYYTDNNVLWAGDLSISGPPGAVPAPPATAVYGTQGLEGVYHVEEDSSFTVNDYLPPGPNWYFSRSFELKGGTTRAVLVQIAAPRSGTARITVNVRATSTTSHDLGITINDTPIGQAVWHEAGHYRIEASFDASLLSPGENVVYLQTDTMGSTKRLDYVEIQPPIEPALRDGDLLVRVADGASASLRVPGATHAIDATSFGHERALAIADGTVSGLVAGQLVFFTDTVREPIWGDEKTLSLAGIQGANYVAVAPAHMLAELDPLLAKRRAEGRQTAALSLDQVQDLFGGGLFGPAAVARLARDLTPTCLLLGAGTTYDYKRNEGRSTPLGIPCGFVHVREGMAASDDLYTNNYTVAVGRLPARTAAELSAIVSKIVAFQPGARVAMLADADDTGSGLDRFAQLQRALADIMPSDLIESSGRSGNAVRTDLINAIRGGDKLVAYQGHGGAEYLGYAGNRVFGVEHCGQVPPSAWLLSTCLTGSYIVNDTSIPVLSHRLLTTPANGAVSALCSTRYGDAALEHEIVRLSLTRMAKGGATWGDILLLLKREIGETETGQIYTLLGDPALRAVDLADPREMAVLSPNAGDLVGGGKVAVRFRLLGEGWTGETVEACYRRAAGNWVRIATVETNTDTTDYEVEWTPPEDGRDYQIMVREVQP